LVSGRSRAALIGCATIRPMHTVELKIARAQARMFRHAREHPRPEFVIVVERKHAIGPSRPRQRVM
jgi:hypothetical protein